MYVFDEMCVYTMWVRVVVVVVVVVVVGGGCREKGICN